MKDTKKKVTKALAREIAAKFFGRTATLVEDFHCFTFQVGLTKLVVYPTYGGRFTGCCYPENKYPIGDITLNGSHIAEFQYIEGKLEIENDLTEEHDAFRNALWQIDNLLEEAIDETKINTGFASDDKYIVRDKAKLLQILKIIRGTEKYL